MEGDKRILLVAQKSAETDDPGAGDLHPIGTLAQVLQLLKLPDGTIKVLVEGLSRAASIRWSSRMAPCRAPARWWPRSTAARPARSRPSRVR